MGTPIVGERRKGYTEVFLNTPSVEISPAAKGASVIVVGDIPVQVCFHDLDITRHKGSHGFIAIIQR